MKVWLCILGCLWAPGVGAYEIMHTVQGAPVHWPTECVEIWLNDQGAQGFTHAELKEVLEGSFQQWNEAQGGDIGLQSPGATCFSEPGIPDWPGAQNVIIFRDGPGDWPHPKRIAALTTLLFHESSGELVDADIEFNGEHETFSATGSATSFSLPFTLTHELGHLLGLDHSFNPGAVMYINSSPKENAPISLHPDDQEAIQAHIPPGDGTTACETPSTFNPDASYCPVAPEATGCTASGTWPSLWVLLLLLFFLRPWRLRGSSCLLLLLILLPSPSQAFEHVRTSTGEIVAWPGTEVAFQVDGQLPPGWDAGDLETVVDAATAPWETIDCRSFTLERAGFTDSATSDLFDRENTLLFVQDDWAFSHSMMAITLLEYNKFTGELRDADILVNNAQKTFELNPVCDPAGPNYDLVNILTHEFGHFIGLDHSTEPQSTMFPDTFEEDCLKRSLAPDDVEGFCATYSLPAAAEADDASAEDVSGAESKGEEDVEPGCGGSPEPPSTHWVWALLLLWLARARPGVMTPRA